MKNILQTLLILLTLYKPALSDCQNSLNNCASCLNAYKCQTCNTGYFIKANYYCVVNPSGCLVFNQYTGCSAPVDGVVLWSSWSWQACNISNCKTCPSNINTCTSCKLGYVLINNTCTQCTDSSCLKCDTNLTCTSCPSLTTIAATYSNTSTCKMCSISNCAKCPYSQSICTQCLPNYYLYSSASCLQCNDDCLLCSYTLSIQVCDTCKSIYYKSPGVGCLLCSNYMAHCLSCSSLMTCTACIDGYGLDTANSTSSCIICNVSNCYSCPSDYNYCNVCNQYYAAYNGICISSIITNCIWPSGVNSSYCVQCTNAYGYNHGGICLPCQTGASYCIQCKQYYKVCTACSSKYGLNTSSTNECVACEDTRCLNCSVNYRVCVECAVDGYGVDSSTGTCRTCSGTLGYCYRCSKLYTFCTACSAYYGPNSTGYCVRCYDYHCSTCTYDYTVCLTCVGSWAPNTSGVCVGCNIPTQYNCSSCTSDGSFCNICMTNYGLTSASSGICTDGNINYCYIYTTYDACLRCYSGGVDRSTNFNNSCTTCTDTHCAQCGYDYTKCQACVNGYGLNRSNYVTTTYQYPSGISISISTSDCVRCNTGCLTCSRYNYKYCYTCQSGYQLNNYYVCIEIVCADQDCPLCSSSATNATCLACYLYQYTYTNGSCYNCSQQCYRCFWNATSANKQQCTQCKQYYSINYTRNPAFCTDTCGDSYYIDSSIECDKQIGVAYDGCTDTCKVQNYFQCQNDNVMHVSVCSFNGTLEMKFVSIQMESIRSNKMDIVVTVFPPLYTFVNSTDEQIFQAFSVSHRILRLILPNFFKKIALFYLDAL